MRYYSEDFKRTTVAKMTMPGGRSATSLSQELGISQSSLSRWIRERATVGLKGDPMRPRRPEDWTAEEKLEALLNYEKLPEDQKGTFLREKGVHETHLARWKAEIIEGLKLKPYAGGKKDAQQKKIAALEKELRRKESALAEAAALLVLKKKADAIWGEEKDEK